MRFWHQLSALVSLPGACAVVLLYVAFITLGRKYMSDRTPPDLSALKKAYNVVQVCVCGATFIGLLPFFVTAEHHYGISLAANANIEFWVFVYYCCKILDLGDTVFIVLGKKDRQLTFLHMWHHASIIPLFSFYLSTGRGAGSISTLPLLNSLIHVLMYSHYLFVTYRPDVKPWWKPILTASQICQHLILMVYMLVNWFSGRRPDDFTAGIFFAGMAWGFSILILFANFYVQQYFGSRNKSSNGNHSKSS